MAEQTPEIQQPQSEKEKKGGSRRILYIILILLLLGVNGFLIYNLMQSKKETKEVTEQKDTADSLYTATKSELMRAKSSIDSLHIANSHLDSLKEVYLAQINGLLAENEKMKGTSSENNKKIKELQKKISELSEQLEMFTAKVDSFKQVTLQLTKDKADLTTNLQGEQQKNTQLTVENKDLSHKVDLGSLLKTINLNAGGIKMKNNGKEVKTNNAKKVDKIKVCFDTGDNKVIESGTDVTFLLQLIGPDGSTVAVQSQGSGYFNLAETGEEKQYTIKQTTSFKQKSQQICVYWSQNTAFAEGKYTAVIYQSGYEIGRTEFELNGGFL